MNNIRVLRFNGTAQELTRTKHDVRNSQLSKAIVQPLPDTQHPLHGPEHQTVGGGQVPLPDV